MENEKMRAVICTAYGLPNVLKIKSIDKPIPQPNELLIKIMASAVNSGDARVRALKANFILRFMMRLIFGFIRPKNPILGTVYAGIIEQIGEQVKDFKVGDEVYGLTGFKFGTYATYITVNEQSVIIAKPKNATFEEAAAIAFGGQTAIYFLQKTKIAEIPNLNILVYGATSSVGTAVIQIAKYYQANITAVCSESGRGLAMSLGANKVMDYKTEDFTQLPNKYDIIFDAVGKISNRECKNIIAKNGIFVTVGGLEIAKETSEQLLFLREQFENGKYNATIDRIYSIDEIVEAHAYVDTGRKKGNVVLKITDNY
ncbi:MAG: NAD(P)-dependent alcohol dehydrogenase [Candidatus Methylacidiphilales bacterium]